MPSEQVSVCVPSCPFLTQSPVLTCSSAYSTLGIPGFHLLCGELDFPPAVFTFRTQCPDCFVKKIFEKNLKNFKKQYLKKKKKSQRFLITSGTGLGLPIRRLTVVQQEMTLGMIRGKCEVTSVGSQSQIFLNFGCESVPGAADTPSPEEAGGLRARWGSRPSYFLGEDWPVAEVLTPDSTGFRLTFRGPLNSLKVTGVHT